MIKDIMIANETVAINEKQMQALREHFPACFHNGEFDLERFKEYLGDSLAVNNEGYELRFLGKNYARLLASIDTTTVVVPDEEHNAKSENANSQNVYISGDNLDGLKHLLKSYSKQVKCIYIDPPYNTGSDGFAYNDTFNFTVDDLVSKLSVSEEQATRILNLTKKGSASHSAWLVFMYPRLLLARDLLDTDGVIFISIDDNEYHNCKLLCDDIFGEENFIANICHKARSSVSNDKIISASHNYLLLYARKIEEIEKIRKMIGLDPDLTGFNMDDNDGKGPYKFVPVDGPGDEAKGNPYYEFLGVKDYFRFSLKTMQEMYDAGLIVKRGNSLQQKYYLSEAKESRKTDTTWWDADLLTSSATKYLNDLMEEKVFNNPKSLNLLKRILDLFFHQRKGIVLDFFAGSSTTAEAAMRYNLTHDNAVKYIMIQINEDLDAQLSNAKTESEKKKTEKIINYLKKVKRSHTLDQIGLERISRAVSKIKEEYPDTTADLGFRHYTLVEPSTDTLDKLEKFDVNENGIFASDMLNEFGLSTVLSTWLVRDGYGLTATPEKLVFADYEAYYIGKHLYLIAQELSKEAIDAILVKYETDGTFNPENIVLFGYSFTWTEMETLKTNLKRLKDIKNLHVNFDVRY